MVAKLKDNLGKIAMLLALVLIIPSLFALTRLLDTKTVNLDLVTDLGLKFPAKLDEGINDKNMQWEEQQNDQESNLSRITWANKDESILSSPYIYMEVFELNNGLEAELHYTNYITKLKASNNWPNFYHPEARYLVDTSEFELLDNNFIACEMGGQDSCQMWRYVGRHGRANVSISYMSPDTSIGTNTFASIVNTIISTIAPSN